MTSRLKTESSFRNTEFREERALMFTVLESKSKHNFQKCLLPPWDMPEVDRVQRILTTP